MTATRTSGIVEAEIKSPGLLNEHFREGNHSMRKKLLFSISILLLISIAASGQQTSNDSKVELGVRYWITDLSSRARVSGGVLEGTDFDVKNDLGLEDRRFADFTFAGRITPSHKVRFEYFQTDYSGDTNLSRTIVFEGQQYDVNTRVVSDFDLKHLRIGYAWQFINNDKVRFGPLVEVRGLWLDARLAAPSEGVSEAREFSAPFPSFGGDLDVFAHPRAHVFATVAGTPENRFGHLFDADLGVNLFPVRNVGVTIGYRYLDIKGKDDDDFATVKIKGPFVGATFRF